MKHLILKIIIPLTIISFALVTKWWYVLQVDGPNIMFKGFPLVYRAPGIFSLSLQIFVIEFIVDFFVYFLFWFVLVIGIDRYLIKVKMYKAITISLWIISSLLIAIGALWGSSKDNSFYMKRPYDIQVLETGYEFLWQYTERPDDKLPPG
jgi:hypothetical protein